MSKTEIIFETLKTKCPDVDDDLIKMHLNRLDDSYFNYFSNPDVICEHLCAMQKIVVGSIFVFLPEFENHGKISCTVISFDYPALFSLIAGILSGMGVQIISGVIFTYSDHDYDRPAKPLLRKIVQARSGEI